MKITAFVACIRRRVVSAQQHTAGTAAAGPDGLPGHAMQPNGSGTSPTGRGRSPRVTHGPFVRWRRRRTPSCWLERKVQPLADDAGAAGKLAIEGGVLRAQGMIEKAG